MNQYYEHQELIKRFKVLAGKQIPNLRIFDRTVGLFYAKRVNGGVIDYTPVKINSKGMADAYGLIKTNKCMLHLEFEVKTGNARQTKDQKNWENFIRLMNGKYIIIRNEFDAINEIKYYLKGLEL